MEVRAEGQYLRISPRKARLVVAAIKKLPIDVAVDKLNFMGKRGGVFVLAVLKSAIANATNNFNLRREDLYIKEFQVGEGPRLKRMDKSHGSRFDRGIKQKRMCHMRLILGVREREKLDKRSLGKVLDKSVKKGQDTKENPTNRENKVSIDTKVDKKKRVRKVEKV